MIRATLSQRFKTHLPRILLLVVLGAALFSMLALWRHQHASAERLDHLRFERLAGQVQLMVVDRLSLFENVLHAGRGLVASLGGREPGAEQWRQFINALELDLNYSGVDAVAFTRYYPAAARASVPLPVFPAGERDDYFVITRIEPHARAGTALGFDMGSEPSRRAAAEQARDSGRPTISEPVTLINTGGARTDLLYFTPLYTGEPKTLEERRQQLLGWVVLGFHAEALMTPALGATASALRLEVFDGAEPLSEEKLYDSNAHSQGSSHVSRFTQLIRTEIGGREWTLRLSSGPEFERSTIAGIDLTLAVDILLTLLLGLSAWLLVTGRDRAVAHAERVTHALAESEERYRQLFMGNKAVLLLIDPADGRIVDANQTALRFYGYSYEQMIQLRISDINTLAPAEVAQEMQAARNEKRNHFFFRHRLASGEVREVEVHSGPVQSGGRELLYSIIHDVTERRYAEQALRESERKYRTIIDTAAEGYWLIDAASKRTLEVNDALLAMLGYRRDEVLGRTPLEFSHEESKGVFEEQFSRIPNTDQRSYDIVLKAKDGSAVDTHFNTTTLRDSAGAPEFAFAFVTDLRERKKTEAELRLAASFFESTSEAMLVTDANNRILAVNQAFTTITGYGADEVLGKTPRLLSSGYHDETFYRSLWRSLENSGHWEGEIWNRRKNGEIYPEWLSISSIRDEHGRLVQYMAIFSDITRRKQDEQKIWHQANFDPLTELPNRTLFVDRLEQAIRHAHRDGTQLALMFIDLDRFKWVNDTHGHHTGDLLLQQAAQRINGAVREGDTVARLGGDEFTVMIPEVNSPRDAERIAAKVLETLSTPFQIEGHEAFISASVGITLYPRDGSSVEELVRNADSAMYRAKEAGRNTHCFYTQAMNVQARQRLSLENDLRRALQNRELEVHYQPLVDIASGRITGAEALLRWNHPERGPVPPSEFIPLAEETGLIMPLEQWVLGVACRDVQDWREHGLELILAVNVSSPQMKQPAAVATLLAIVAASGLPPRRLKLEITERLMMEDTDHVVATLGALRNHGISFAVDDFGTGYSSLSYLKRFPLDTLKVDRAFIADLPGNRDDVALVEAMIGMAHSLGLSVVAEGVETQEQLEFLRRHACDQAQGYLFARALPADQFLDYALGSGAGALKV